MFGRKKDDPYRIYEEKPPPRPLFGFSSRTWLFILLVSACIALYPLFLPFLLFLLIVPLGKR